MLLGRIEGNREMVLSSRTLRGEDGRPCGSLRDRSTEIRGDCVCAEEYEGDYPKCFTDRRRKPFRALRRIALP